jgi:hypothetical protein
MTQAYLTQNDVDNYGADLLNVSQRAALHSVAPILQRQEQLIADLQARQARDRRHRLDQEVEQAIPNYRDFDRDPRWHQWLSGTDGLSGCMRQQLLNEAIASGNTNRVVAFFRQFASQAGQPSATGSSRAYGRSRTASAGQPFYSRADITRLYDAHRRGAYNGREADWARQEADIFAAQREGRIEQKPYFTK